MTQKPTLTVLDFVDMTKEGELITTEFESICLVMTSRLMATICACAHQLLSVIGDEDGE